MTDDLLPPPPEQVTLIQLDLHNTTAGAIARASHEVTLVLRGRYRVLIGQDVLTAGPGDLVYLPRGLSHHTDSRRDGSVQLFLLWFADDRFGDEAWVLRDANSRLLVLLHWLRDHSPMADERDRRLHRYLLGAIFCELEQLREQALTDRDPLRQAQEFLRHNFQHPIDLKEVCTIVGLGRSELIRRFRQATGLPPMAWLQRLRARKALDMLITSREPVLTVAKTVGFRSAAHLSRLIRREFGRSPRYLRGNPPPATA